MCRFIFLVLTFLVYEQTVFSASVDQRQTGDLNVQIDLKNLQIVGLLKGKEEYVDYDYAYDYSEMTIKPPSGTKKPLNVTKPAMSDKDNTTVSTTVFTELDQTTSSSENSSLSSEMTTTTIRIEENEYNSTIINTTESSSQDSVGKSTVSPNCKKGFFRNSKGNCELKLQNLSNALLKMIRQKPKLNNRSNGERRL